MHTNQNKPHLTLSRQPKWNYYGTLRKRYLKQSKPEEYILLLMTGQLATHLKRVGEETKALVEQSLKEILQQSPPPEKEKAPLAWQSHMQKLKRQAEEQVFPETIYK